MTAIHPRKTAWLAVGLAVTLATAIVSASPRAADDVEKKAAAALEVHEWSVWVGSPSQPRLNTARIYRNAMPDAAGTVRSGPGTAGIPSATGPAGAGAGAGAESRKNAVAPVSVVQVFGPPSRDVDVDLRVKKGTLLSHWPPGTDRGGRVQWFQSDLLAESPADRPPGHIPEAHWSHSLRKVEPALYLATRSRSERFVAYDAEVALGVPLKLRGGPEEYTLQNLTAANLKDVAVIVPTPKGYRVGWLDTLPAAVPERAGETPKKPTEAPPTKEAVAAKAEAVFRQAEAEPKKGAAGEDEAVKPLPPEAGADVRANLDQALNRAVTLPGGQASRKDALALVASQARFRYELDAPTITKAGVDLGQSLELAAGRAAARDALAEILGTVGLSYRVTEEGSLFITTAARLTEASAKSTAPVEGPPVKLTLSQPLKAGDPSYHEMTRDSYARRLASQGLREEVAKAMLDRHATDFFEPEGLIVLAHLARETIDDAVSLDVFPAPARFVRVAAVVVQGIDPRLQDEARALVKRLGNPSPAARESAESELLALGPVSIPALEDALREDDVEIVFRAERILMRLNRPVP